MKNLSNATGNHRHVFTLASTLLLQCAASPALANSNVPVIHDFASLHNNVQNGHHGNSIYGNHFVSSFMPVLSPHVTLAATGSAPFGQGLALNLSSVSQNISLGSQLFSRAQSLTINVGGTLQTFKSGDQVTAAEYVAIQQVASGGTQGITLNGFGAATGGSFSLNAAEKGADFTSVTIPSNVIAIDNVTRSSLTINGDLINYGTLDAVSRGLASATISATDITNEAGASISGSNSIKGGTLNLNLDAGGSISNAGTIASSGNVTLSAGSGNITNPGLVSSTNGSITLTSPNASSSINVNGSGGTFQALNGNINIRDASYNGSADINLVGGNYLSQNLNLNSGTGSITTNVGQVTGTVNSSADSAHEYVSTSNLVLGSNHIDGDPTYVNTDGNITINGGVVSTEAIAIIASGSIIGTGNAYISTARPTGTAAAAPQGNVTLIAGAAVAVTGGNTTSLVPGLPIGAEGSTATATVTFGTGTGGNIDFSKDTHVGAIISTGSALPGNGNQNANSGNVILAAQGGAAAATGQVLFPSKSNSIVTTSTYGNAGNVTIFAGQSVASSASKPSISVGTISTAAGTTLGKGTDGNVIIESAQPTSTAPVVFNADGVITSANTITGSALLAGNIQLTGSITTGTALNTTATIQTSGAGTIVQSVKGIDVSTNTLDLGNQSAGIGTSASASFATAVTNLTVNTTGNAFINNNGSVNLDASNFGSATSKTATFSLTTTPNVAGDGAITIAGNVTGTSTATGTSTITLQSSELTGNVGGITDPVVGKFPAAILTANIISLSDGTKGTGDGSIGTKADPIITALPAGTSATAITLSGNTSGLANVWLQNTNSSATLLNSSAGQGGEFSLTTVQNATALANSNGQITIAGTIKTSVGLIGIINLSSSEQGTGTGGIVQKSGSLTAIEATLADSLFAAGASTGLGTGLAAIGTTKAPISLNVTDLSAATSLNTPTATNANVYLNDTTKGGAVLITNAGVANSANTVYSLTSSSGITTNSGITTFNNTSGDGNITLKASGSGYIVVGSNLITTAANTTINLTGTGTGSIDTHAGDTVTTDITTAVTGGSTGTVNITAGNEISGSFTVNTENLNVTAGGAVSITNTAGSNQTLTLGTAKVKEGFSLTTGGSLVVTPALTSATSIGLTAGTTTSKAAPTAVIDIDNNLGGTGTSTVSILNAGTGAGSNIVTNVTGKITPLLTAKGVIILTANDGSIEGGAANQPINVSAPLLAANNVTANGTGANIIDLNSLSTKATALLNSASDGTFTLTTKNSLTLNNLQAVNGSIDVVANGPSLSVSPNTIITVGTSAKTTAPAGSSLLLENGNSKTGTILIGGGANISTFLPTPGNFFNISIGTPPATPPASAGTIPAATEVLYTPAATATGPYFFPTQGLTISNVLTGVQGVAMNAVGAGTIVFTIPTGDKATAITIQAGAAANPTTFTSDPPPVSGAPSVQAIQGTGQSGLAQTANLVAQPVTMHDPGSNTGTPLAISGSGSLFSSSSGSSSTSGSGSGQDSDPSGQAFNLPATLQATALSAIQQSTVWQNTVSGRFGSEPNWISETELSGGAIPAIISADDDFGITCPVSSIVDLKADADAGASAGTGAGTRRSRNAGTISTSSSFNPTKLEGHVSNSSLDSAAGAEHPAFREAPRTMSLTRGAVVFAPRIDTSVKTPFGTVKIGARSLVFVVSLPQGIAIYNLDDTHHNAVSVNSGANSIAIGPGQMATIAFDHVASFDKINPCQMVLYRNLNSRSHADGLTAFTAEFHAPSLLHSVMPLKALTTSKNADAQRLVNHLLKTTAISMGLSSGNGAYQQVLRARHTAMLP